MRKKSTISEALRDAIRKCEKSRYRIHKETGIDQGMLSRFLNTDASLSLTSVDKLCEFIGARLVVDAKGSKQRATAKKPIKRSNTKSKRKG
jgi:hypothetical protein